MRIAYVLTGGVDRSGRTHVIPSLLALIERMARRHDVCIYVLRYHPMPCSYPLLGATVHDLGRPSGVTRQYSAALHAIRRDRPFDLIHAYWALPAGLVTALVGRRLGIPSIVTYDSGEFVAHPSHNYGLQRHWRQRLAVNATARLSTRATVCSAFMARLAERHGIQADLIPLGVDRSVFSPGARPEGPPWRLLHVASLNPIKDQKTLLDALTLVVARVPDTHLDIVGEDTLGGALQAYAHQAGLDNHVTFHGFLPTDQLVPFYQRAHLLVMSSAHEAANVSVLEAAACGVPVVGTAVGPIVDWHPDRAVAVPTGNARALSDAVVSVLNSSETRSRLAAAAREYALEHDADWTAREFERIYEEIGTRA